MDQTNNTGSEVITDPTIPAVQDAAPTSNRDLIFKGEAAPAAVQAPEVPVPVTPVQDTPSVNLDQSPTQQEAGQETLEVSEGFDVVNLGESQEQGKETSQKGPQVDELTTVKEQNALLTQIINQMQQGAQAPNVQATQPDEQKKPEFKDYKDNENLSGEEAVAKFAEDMASWKVDQTLGEVLEKQKVADSEEKQKTADVQLRESFNGGIADAEARYNGKFSSSLLNANLSLRTDTMREIMGATDYFKDPGLSHDIVYHLSNRKDVVGLLNSSSQVRAGMMIGDIARKIINGKQANTRKITEAPKPVTPVRPGSRVTQSAPTGGTPLKTLIGRKGGQRHL